MDIEKINNIKVITLLDGTRIKLSSTDDFPLMIEVNDFAEVHFFSEKDGELLNDGPRQLSKK